MISWRSAMPKSPWTMKKCRACRRSDEVEMEMNFHSLLKIAISIALLNIILVPCYSMNIAPKLQKNHHPLTKIQFNELMSLPHVGYVTDPSLEVFVVGTSHFRCNSAREVSSLIEQVHPDGVLIELDPERALRLTKQHAGFDENGIGEQREASEDLLYGADFVAAVDACQRLDIPLFLGDEYAQETKHRLTQQFLNWKAYSPYPLAQSLLGSISADKSKKMNLIRTFARDPQKLLPIVVSSSPPLLLASVFTFFDNGALAYDGSTISNTAEVITSIIASTFASSLLFNTVIAERDKILAESTIKASKVLRSLKEKKSVRKRWQFTVKGLEDQMVTDTGTCSDSLPLFTLKTPLVKNAKRHLNLFEPRWLKMIDDVTKDSDPLKDDTVFGCVRATNKFYSAMEVNGEEGRYADIIFEKKGTLARIKSITEGARPVSGDRKIGVSIEGSDCFAVDESNISISNGGYMVARAVKKQPVESNVNDGLSLNDGVQEKVRMVVVVGLLHGNGVVDLLSTV
ncbi:hypothetical protein ACHAWF_004486 [Thalassiosira exigua]